MMSRTLTLFLVLGACADTPHSHDVPDLVDVVPDASDTTTDTDTRPDLEDFGPVEPHEGPLEVAWALQSDHSPSSWFGWPTVTPLSDGSLIVAGLVNRVVSFGGHTLDTQAEDPYTNAVAAKLTTGGEVVDLRRLCERCLTGTTPLLALPGGRYAFASTVHGEVVLAPDTGTPRIVNADHELLVVIVGADGGVEDHALVARVDQGASPQAMTLTSDGGLAIGGSAWSLAIDNGPTFEAQGGWHYPGRAFLVVLDAELRPRHAELLGGEAGSTIAMLHAEGDALYAVGDFGGYPLGVATTFDTGLETALTLESVSSDDDPAMDLFVARWTLPEPSLDAPTTRPRIDWAKRLAHYQNGPRQPTWLRASEGGVEFRVDGAGRLETDGAHFALPRPDEYWTSVVVRMSADGEATQSLVARGNVEPLPDGGYLSVASHWPGSTYEPAGPSGPRFTVPAATDGPDGVTPYGHVLARWRSDGALLAAGQLIAESPSSYSSPTVQHLVPQSDGAAYLVLHGAAPVTFVSSSGARLPLLREANYERVIVLRVDLRLGGLAAPAPPR